MRAAAGGSVVGALAWVGAILGAQAAIVVDQLPFTSAIGRLPVILTGLLLGARVALALGAF